MKEDLDGAAREEDVAKYEQSKERRFRLVFRQNRSFELTIRGTTYFFEPFGKQEVPESVVLAMTESEKSFFNVEGL